MHYRIFSILVTFVCLFGCALITAAQDVNNTDETEKPVILYSGTPKKYEIADIKVEGAQNYEDYVTVGLSPNVMAAGGFTNGYGFKQE